VKHRERNAVDSHPSSHNLAAGMARWSSRHRKKAFWGWLAFVILAFAIGNAVGANSITDVDNFNGESRDRGLTTDEAIRRGIATTAGTVTSAAAVMVAVFLVFVTLTFIDFKEMGLGLAAAVLIDATIIRGILLPAAMKLLGDWNWYLPGWLGWLPRVGIERDAGRPPEPEDVPGPAPVPA
jgi:hypothetical protein